MEPRLNARVKLIETSVAVCSDRNVRLEWLSARTYRFASCHRGDAACLLSAYCASQCWLMFASSKQTQTDSWVSVCELYDSIHLQIMSVHTV